VTKKPTGGPDETSESGGHTSLDEGATPGNRSTVDTTDRQNLADTMTVPLPPENRTGPRRSLEELVTPMPISMDRTPITDRYEGALDLMGIPDTESVLDETPASTEARSEGPRAGEGWFESTGKPAPHREAAREAHEEPIAGVPVRSGPPPILLGGMAAALVLVFAIGFWMMA
jgi:hypothetical protein